MDSGIVIAIISLLVSLGSAAIAYLAVCEQRRLTTNVTSFTQIATAELLLERHPELLALHGIDQKSLDECGVTHIELVYLTQSFAASEFYHRLTGEEEVELTEYRKTLLKCVKVQRAWRTLIKGRLVSVGPFTNAVDRYLELHCD